MAYDQKKPAEIDEEGSQCTCKACTFLDGKGVQRGTKHFSDLRQGAAHVLEHLVMDVAAINELRAAKRAENVSDKPPLLFEDILLMLQTAALDAQMDEDEIRKAITND